MRVYLTTQITKILNRVKLNTCKIDASLTTLSYLNARFAPTNRIRLSICAIIRFVNLAINTHSSNINGVAEGITTLDHSTSAGKSPIGPLHFQQYQIRLRISPSPKFSLFCLICSSMMFIFWTKMFRFFNSTGLTHIE